MLGQKEAVIKEVKHLLPSFTSYKDIALVMLTTTQLESLKHKIGIDIRSGYIEYSKNKLLTSEVMAYARSMVMNHLKKAKELNGNQDYGNLTSPTKSSNNKAFAGIDMGIMPQYLQEYVKTLV